MPEEFTNYVRTANLRIGEAQVRALEDTMKFYEDPNLDISQLQQQVKDHLIAQWGIPTTVRQSTERLLAPGPPQRASDHASDATMFQYIEQRDAPVPAKMQAPKAGGGAQAVQGGFGGGEAGKGAGAEGGGGRGVGAGRGGGGERGERPAAPPKKVGPNLGDQRVMEALKRRAEQAKNAEEEASQRQKREEEEKKKKQEERKAGGMGEHYSPSPKPGVKKEAAKKEAKVKKEPGINASAGCEPIRARHSFGSFGVTCEVLRWSWEEVCRRALTCGLGAYPMPRCSTGSDTRHSLASLRLTRDTRSPPSGKAKDPNVKMKAKAKREREDGDGVDANDKEWGGGRSKRKRSAPEKGGDMVCEDDSDYHEHEDEDEGEDGRGGKGGGGSLTIWLKIGKDSDALSLSKSSD